MVGTRVRKSSSTSKRPQKQVKVQRAVDDAHRLVQGTERARVTVASEEVQVTVESARATYRKARHALETQLKKQVVREFENTVRRTQATINRIQARFAAIDYEACRIYSAFGTGAIFQVAFKNQEEKLVWWRDTGDGDRGVHLRPFLVACSTPPTPEERDYMYEYLKFMTWAVVRKMHTALLADGMSVVPLSVIRKELSIF